MDLVHHRLGCEMDGGCSGLALRTIQFLDHWMILYCLAWIAARELHLVSSGELEPKQPAYQRSLPSTWFSGSPSMARTLVDG